MKVNERFDMMTTWMRTAATLSLLLSLAGAHAAVGADSASPKTQASYKGTVIAIDRKEHSLSVHSFWSTKMFNAADDCRLSVEDKPEASWNDLRPGQRVEVGYQDAQGVLVARAIDQEDVGFPGHITAMNPEERKLTIKGRQFAKQFIIPDDCQVVLKDDKEGPVKDLKIGQFVNVIYEDPPNGSPTARRIEQESDTFVGKVRAIDAEANMIKAKRFLREKKFHLAKGCQIVVNGQPGGELSDLRIGDEIAVNFEDEHGVLVANRIGREEEASETRTAQAGEAGNP
jgi:hypothetical protein